MDFKNITTNVYQSSIPTQSSHKFSNYFNTLLASSMVLVFGLLSGVLAARLLKPLGRGELSVLLYFPSMMGSIFCLSIPTALTFYIAKNIESNQKYIIAGLKLSFLLALMGSATFSLLAPWFVKVQDRYLLNGIVVICGLGVGMVITPNLHAINWGLGRYKWCNLVKVLTSISYVLGIIILWRIGNINPLKVAALAMGVQIFASVMHLIKLGKMNILLPVERGVYKELMYQGLKYFLPVSMFIVYSLLDRFILMRTTSLEQLGFYSISFAIASPILFLADSVSQIGFAEISRGKDSINNWKAFRTQFKGMQALIIAYIIFSSSLTYPIIRLIFGKEYLLAIPITLILCVAVPLHALTVNMQLCMRAQSLVWQSTKNCIVAVLFLVLGGYWASLKWGVIGFACVLLMANVLNLTLHIMSIKRITGFLLRDIIGLNKNELGKALTLLLEQIKVKPKFIIGLKMKFYFIFQKPLKALRLENIYKMLLKEVPLEKFRALTLKYKYEIEHFPDSSPKFTNYEYWIRLNIVRCDDLGLIGTSQLKILDIGCGSGYLAWVMKKLGHDVIALDQSEKCMNYIDRKVYKNMTTLLKVPVVRENIVALKKLKIKGRYDLITCYLICFNNHKKSSEWELKDWKYFIEDMNDKLNNDGVLMLELNENKDRYENLKYFDEETCIYFNKIGKIRENKVFIQKRITHE